jgi:hypothetical protein
MLVLVALFGAVVMLLWNAIIPDITGWKAINYWQALGLLVLCKILFGGFGGPKHHQGRPPFMMRKFREKFANATPEEREALKAEWRNRCQGMNKNNEQ